MHLSGPFVYGTKNVKNIAFSLHVCVCTCVFIPCDPALKIESILGVRGEKHMGGVLLGLLFPFVSS